MTKNRNKLELALGDDVDVNNSVAKEQINGDKVKE
jgi:hypothetical protein